MRSTSSSVRHSRARRTIESPESGRNVATAKSVGRVVRRVILWPVLVGGAALLASWPLWHFTRADVSGCRSGVPCDPGLYLPFGSVALGLTIAGVLALLTATTLVVALLLRGVIRLDARERQARRE